MNEFVAMVNNSLWLFFRYLQVPREIITVANNVLACAAAAVAVTRPML